MIPVDLRAEEFREAVASSNSLRNAKGWSCLPACGTQRGNAREFVVSAQAKDQEIETTDAHR
jgi:hypothetical protein